jgi:hypothetical protein
MKKVKIDAIRIDGGTQCRIVIDQPTVYSYRDSMKEGDEFPEIETVFDGSTHWLTDGFHRYHAFKLLGLKEVMVDYKPGTLQDAQLQALKANSRHGKPLTNEDKRNKVEMALKIDGFDKKTSYEIAKICQVSQPFVASVRDPKAKKKQAEDKIKHVKNKAEELQNTNLISSDKKNSLTGQQPDENEMKASELALVADQEAMYKLLESDEPLKTAHLEIKRLNRVVATLETAMHGVENERNSCIKQIKQLQKENTKLKGTK